MAHRRDPEFIGQTDEYGYPITTYQMVPIGGMAGGGLGAPGTTGAEGTFDPLGAPGSTGAEPTTATGYDLSGGQGQLRLPTGTGIGVGHAHQGTGRAGITTTEGYGMYKTTGMGGTGARGGYDSGMGHTGSTAAGYDTGMRTTEGLGTGYDTGMGTTGGFGTRTGTGTRYDTGMGTKGGLGTSTSTGYDTGGYTTGSGHDVGVGETDRPKKGMTERILEHLPGTGRKSQ